MSIENATERVTVRASSELLAQMEAEWSPAVRVRASRNVDGTWEMWFIRADTREFPWEAPFPGHRRANGSE